MRGYIDSTQVSGLSNEATSGFPVNDETVSSKWLVLYTSLIISFWLAAAQ